VPQQSGVVEQKNRTLIEMARMMLDEHRIPRRFWADAINTACYISNQIFICSILNLTPFELCFGCCWWSKKCIYLPSIYLHFMQDIEDRCLLLTSFTSFVDLPFQEHWIIKKHHMDQNPYISSLCQKPGVVSDNMTWGDNVAKSLGPTDPRWSRPAPLIGRPASVWRQ
jgi:hypothetical protein